MSKQVLEFTDVTFVDRRKQARMRRDVEKKFHVKMLPILLVLRGQSSSVKPSDVKFAFTQAFDSDTRHVVLFQYSVSPLSYGRLTPSLFGRESEPDPVTHVYVWYYPKQNPQFPLYEMLLGRTRMFLSFARLEAEFSRRAMQARRYQKRIMILGDVLEFDGTIRGVNPDERLKMKEIAVSYSIK